MNIVDPIKKPEDIVQFTEYLHKHSTQKIFTIWVFGVNTGLRISDLLSLKWSDIIMGNDENSDWYFIQKAEKTGKVHTVFLCDMVKKSLMALHVSYPNDIYIFQSDYQKTKKGTSRRKASETAKKGTGKSKANGSDVSPLTRAYISQTLSKFGKKFNPNLHISSHTMRKTCAYALRFERNVELEIVSKVLQHSSISITMNYFGLSDEETKQAFINANIGERKKDSEEEAIQALKRQFDNPYVFKAFSSISCYNDFSFFNSKIRLKTIRNSLARTLEVMIQPAPKGKTRYCYAKEIVDIVLNYCRSIYDMQKNKKKSRGRHSKVMEKDAGTGLFKHDFDHLVPGLCRPRRKTISPLTDIQDELEELTPKKK